tara:strand:+ start:186 stop:428 length:243 start_codon:yes stop_codon:yes gene_type:complete
VDGSSTLPTSTISTRCITPKGENKMETLQQIVQFVGTHALALGIGVGTGLVVENITSPVKRIRAKLASLLGKAEDAVSEK